MGRKSMLCWALIITVASLAFSPAVICAMPVAAMAEECTHHTSHNGPSHDEISAFAAHTQNNGDAVGALEGESAHAPHGSEPTRNFAECMVEISAPSVLTNANNIPTPDCKLLSILPPLPAGASASSFVEFEQAQGPPSFKIPPSSIFILRI